MLVIEFLNNSDLQLWIKKKVLYIEKLVIMLCFTAKIVLALFM